MFFLMTLEKKLVHRTSNIVSASYCIKIFEWWDCKASTREETMDGNIVARKHILDNFTPQTFKCELMNVVMIWMKG